MYQYDQYDRRMLTDRVRQFSGQTERFLRGELTEDQFRPLRLQNGLYIERLAPMLRIAIPYGMLSVVQLRRLAKIARDFDKGYGHFSTRQNIQFNWPRLEEVPQILAELAEVDMHAIQASGSCIRNITSDQFAGAAADEIEDPRPWAELIRQWATFHPEFAFLPRKFKIAVSASQQDRAAVQVHDIGVLLRKDDSGATCFTVLAGGGLGRTPLIGEVIRERLPPQELLNYLEAILRVYNRYGRRDNKYKARIKILVKALGVDGFRARVEAQYAKLQNGAQRLSDEAIQRARDSFTLPDYQTLDLEAAEAELARLREDEPAFDRWMQRNVDAHQVPGYAIATLSLKPTGVAPGDATDQQMDIAADLAERYSFAELRVSHKQNLVLADVRIDEMHALWREAKAAGMATPNIGLLNDAICCPGGDFCALANAKSIPVAEAIQREFDDIDYQHDIGDIDLNISGCMNACGHHHVGHIGILGVDKKGREFFQVSLGGHGGTEASIGKILGPSFAAEEIPGVMRKILNVYLRLRFDGESFIETVRRCGIDPFKESVYAATH